MTQRQIVAPKRKFIKTPSCAYDPCIEDPSIKRLQEMLSYRRPAGTPTEECFIEDYLSPLNGFNDDYGNLLVEVGRDSRVIWSSHTDTVHRYEGVQKISTMGAFSFTLDNRSACLGADCTTGVWLMVEMIEHQVPGLYIFHREEELGGRGSSHLAEKHHEFLEQYKFAIAFDRLGTKSIITHQMVGRTCSQAFVDSLSPLLLDGYKADSGGTFTDTANYAHIVPECTNISVGYYHQHSKRESQDLSHALALRNKMITFDESTLVCRRDPSIKESKTYVYPAYSNGNYSTNTPVVSKESISVSSKDFDSGDFYDTNPTGYKAKTVDDFCKRNADIAADILIQLGYDAKTLYEEFPHAF